MAWTQADADALKVAIAQGVEEVEFGGRRQRFRSLEHLRDTLALIQADLAASTVPTRPKQFLAYSAGKGL